VPRWREHSVGLCSGSVRPSVCGQGKLQSSQRFLKGYVGKNRIGADAHDLGV